MRALWRIVARDAVLFSHAARSWRATLEAYVKRSISSNDAGRPSVLAALSRLMRLTGMSCKAKSIASSARMAPANRR